MTILKKKKPAAANKDANKPVNDQNIIKNYNVATVYKENYTNENILSYLKKEKIKSKNNSNNRNIIFDEINFER